MKKKDTLPPQPDTPVSESVLSGLARGGCGSLPAQPDASPLRLDSKECFDALVEHWIKARIDGPMQAVARHDEAAKQLVTTGGLMQGVLVAAFSLMEKQGGGGLQSKGWWVVPLVVLFLTSLLGFFVCAMKVCWPQPKTNASDVYLFLKEAMSRNASSQSLDGMMYTWCGDVEQIHREKKRWLLAQGICFTLCSVLIIALILILMGG